MFPRRNNPFTYQGGTFTPRSFVPRDEGQVQSSREPNDERLKRNRFNFRAFDAARCDRLPPGARTMTSHLDGVTLDVERKTWDFRSHCELEVRHLIAEKRHHFITAVGEHFAHLQSNNILLPDSNLKSCDVPWARFRH